MIKLLKKEKPTEKKKEKTTKAKKKEIIESVALNTEMSSADVATLKQQYATSDTKISKATQESEYNIILNEQELDIFIEKIKQEGVSTI